MEKKTSLMIIDDDEDDRQWIISAIEPYIPQIHFVEAHDGREALDFLLKGMKPALVFLDLNMPKMNGFQFLQSLDKNGMRDIPVVAISTSSRPEEIGRAIRLGAIHYIVKPFTKTKLSESMREVLAGLLSGDIASMGPATT